MVLSHNKKRPRPAAVITWVAALSSLSAVNPVLAFTTRSSTLRVPAPSSHARRAKSEPHSDSEADDEDDLDWRGFRARLIEDGLKILGEGASPAAADTAFPDADSTHRHRYAHECTPLVEVGTILVSIPTTDLCQALEQQYWHRSVVLITAVSSDVVNGEEETVPEEQLAWGDNRGRWSYRGVLLNRITDVVVEDNNDDINRWRILCGGDLAGIESSSGLTEFTCLHDTTLNSMSNPDVSCASTPIVGNLGRLSLEDARTLCALSNYGPDDFYTYAGFCSWRPGQLEREMGKGRGEWLALSVDAGSVLDEMRRQQLAASAIMADSNHGSTPRRLLQAGTTMWKSFLDMIGRSESRATERIPVGQLEFYDHMLDVWADENLCIDGNTTNISDVNETCIHRDSRSLIGPGSLVRATARVSNDVLLFDQEFIKSLILVLEETPGATIGIILNHPLSAAVECLENQPPLPLRYGGPSDPQDWKDGNLPVDLEDADNEEMYEGFLEFMNDLQRDGVSVDDYNRMEQNDDEDSVLFDEDDRDDSPFIWIHRDASLPSQGPKGGGGSPLGTSGLWMIKEDDALSALQSGRLSQKDVMVFSGVCIWEKAPDLGMYQGGLREQIDGLQSLENVQAFNDEGGDGHRIINTVWDILRKGQDILTKESFDTNIDAALEAWSACTPNGDSPVLAKDAFREELSDAVLRAWLGVNLLGDPLGTFVALKNGHESRATD